MSVSWTAPATPENLGITPEINGSFEGRINLSNREVPERREIPQDSNVQPAQTKEADSTNQISTAQQRLPDVLPDLSAAFPKVSALGLASTWSAIQAIASSH